MANKTKIENLQDLIKDSIGGELVEQTVTSLLPPGENFGSIMYKVDFKVKKDGKEEEYHAVAKCTPLNPVTQELFDLQRTTKLEIAWYTTIIPTLKQFQRDQGVKKEIDFFQPFYGARISLDPTSDKVDEDGVILTQNLKVLGYDNVDRHTGFDLPTTHAILRDLANFHAVPLAIRIRNLELFNAKIKKYVPPFKMAPGLQEEANSKVFTILEQVPECQPFAEKVKANVNQAIMFETRPLREPWITIVHMDFWMNNIMVTGGEDPKTMILDLQLPVLGSPAADLGFFLLTSVNLDIIKEKFDDLVKFYYEQFCKQLKQLNVSTENYTFEGFVQEVEQEIKNGDLSHALHHVIYIYEDKGTVKFDSADVNFTKESYRYEIVANEKQKEKIRWLVFEAIKRKWI